MPLETRALHEPFGVEIVDVRAVDTATAAGIDRRNLFDAGNEMWTRDSSFERVPAMASLSSAREVPPEGGETRDASIRVASERRPDQLQACELLGMPAEEARARQRR